MADGRGLPYRRRAPSTSPTPRWSSTISIRDDAVAFLRELRRVAAARASSSTTSSAAASTGSAAWLLIHATATSRFTRHDGPLSVRRAYTRAELLDLVAARGPRAGRDGRRRSPGTASRSPPAEPTRRRRASTGEPLRCRDGAAGGPGRRRRPGRRGDRDRAWRRRGRDVLVLERAPAWRWRACGVFTSPATVRGAARARTGASRSRAGRAADPRDAGRDADRDARSA